MTDENNPSGPEQPGPDDVTTESLTGEILWQIAMREQECEDPKLFREAQSYAAVLMRLQGTEYRDMAQMLGCSVGWAWNLVKRALDKTIDEPADSIRRLHLRRYENMLSGCWDRATEGDSFAIESAIKIMGKIEALMGVEPPKQVHHTFGADAVDEARTALAKRLAAAASAGSDNGDSPEPPTKVH